MAKEFTPRRKCPSCGKKIKELDGVLVAGESYSLGSDEFELPYHTGIVLCRNCAESKKNSMEVSSSDFSKQREP